MPKEVAGKTKNSQREEIPVSDKISQDDQLFAKILEIAKAKAAVEDSTISDFETLKLELATREEEIAKLRGELLDLEEMVKAPFTMAVQIAQNAGIPVPENYKEYLPAATKKGRGRKASQNQEGMVGTHNRGDSWTFYAPWYKKGEMPVTADLSYTQYLVSQGSSGSGSNGVLHVPEITELIESCHGPLENLEIGKFYEIAIPNRGTARFRKNR